MPRGVSFVLGILCLIAGGIVIWSVLNNTNPLQIVLNFFPNSGNATNVGDTGNNGSGGTTGTGGNSSGSANGLGTGKPR